tara:strand:- start:244 stop:540 length:297 start_codon:yes stop_codon:yes gene_type:complete
MIDKLNNINATNAQNKRSVEENKAKVSSSEKAVIKKENSISVDKVEITSNTDTAEMAKNAPLDLDKVSAIKDALSRGDYPMNLEKVADALLQAYKDLK